MSGKQTRIAARGDEFALSHTTPYSLLLPIVQLETLQGIAPERVNWVFEQTQIESEFRRTGTHRVNSFVFFERIVGLVFALIIAVLGLSIAAYLALSDKTAVASVISSATLVGLVVAFIVGKSGEDSSK